MRNEGIEDGFVWLISEIIKLRDTVVIDDMELIY